MKQPITKSTRLPSHTMMNQNQDIFARLQNRPSSHLSGSHNKLQVLHSSKIDLARRLRRAKRRLLLEYVDQSDSNIDSSRSISSLSDDEGPAYANRMEAELVRDETC